MSFAKKNNSKNEKLFNFTIPEGFDYKNLKQLVSEYGADQIHMVNALYINTKGKYGDAPVIATDNELVNAPQHLVNTVKDIMKDGESISTINNGYAGFKIYPYENKYGLCYGLQWVDIDEKPAKKK
jgi:hypothetical protein